MALDLVGNPADHLHPLRHRGDVPDRNQVLDLQSRQRPGDLVEPELVPLQGGQGLVGAGEDGGGVLEHVAGAAGVHRDDAHGLADRDDGVARLPGHALGGAVPRAGLAGGQLRVGHQLDGRAENGAGRRVEHDGAVHLGQLPQPGGGELDAELEPAGAQVLHGLVMAQHDQATGDGHRAAQVIGATRDLSP